MSQHMIGSHVEFNVTDKRRSGIIGADGYTRLVNGEAAFTTNAAGTTTTLVGAAVDYSVSGDANAIRVGEEFMLYNSTPSLKENTVFTVTAVTDDGLGAATVTFSPAAAVATASGDEARLASLDSYKDIESLDDRLTTLGYSSSDLNTMTLNDKVYAVRLADNPDSI